MLVVVPLISLLQTSTRWLPALQQLVGARSASWLASGTVQALLPRGAWLPLPHGGPAGIVEVEAPTQFADGGNDPAVEHAMVAQPAAAPAAAPANALALLPRAFRLRCSSVLFTYNSRTPPPLFGSDQVGWARRGREEA